MKKLLGLLLLTLGLSAPLRAEVVVGPKHIFIMYPGLDAIWGSYLFAVVNTGAEPERYTFPVMLPSETIDFQGQDQIAQNEILPGKDGGVQVDKVFAPGETLLQISFKLPANQGQASANITPPYPFQSLGVFVWKDSLTVEGPEGLTINRGVNLSGRDFDTYTLNGGEGGKKVSFVLQGIPEGRGRLWIIGGVFAGVLLLAAFALAFFSRPKIQEEAV